MLHCVQHDKKYPLVILSETKDLKTKSIFSHGMKPIGTHNYFVYILTNYRKTVLYTGITENLKKRLYEHEEDSKDEKKHFAGKYQCIYLIYYERFEWVEHAIAREKQIKGWTRAKKEALINSLNPNWEFLNDIVL